MKPAHNVYDNIWELRQRGYPSKEQLVEVFTAKADVDLSPGEMTVLGKAVLVRSVEKFLRLVLHKTVSLPIYKCVVPRLNGQGGAIYYVVCCMDDYTYVFRGTFGYDGTGPHESALAEAVFEKVGFQLEVRDGDYLLGFSGA